ncbi:MAG: hypothetical protein ACK4TA_12350 [Saprospiraceae bacterium]
MVPELRRRHRLLWQMWAVLLPIGFVIAILALPKQPTQAQLYDNTAAPLDKLEQTRETEWLLVRLFAADSLHKQLEITVKKPLNVPATQVFWQDRYLGNLGAKGVKRFPLDSALLAGLPYVLEIKDPINQNIFQTIIIQP